MEKIIDMLMENKLFEKQVIRMIIYLVTFLFSLLILYIIIENIFYNKYNVSDANAGLLSGISFMLFLLTLIGLAKGGKEKIRGPYADEIIDFIRENDGEVIKYDDLYKELLGKDVLKLKNLSKNDKENIDKEKKRIRTTCRRLKTQKIIDFEKGGKNFRLI